MRFNLTPASCRVLDRASRLRLQRGMAAISSAKLLWALFEEDECRAAQWLQEAGLSLPLFWSAFGIQTLESPISAPPFPAGSYGVSTGQYVPPNPTSRDVDSARTDNNSPPAGNPYPHPLPPDESDQDTKDEDDEPPQDVWQPSESPKYSLYSSPSQERKTASQLQFYLDDQWINAGLFTPELEDNLETVALRFVRQDCKQSISVSGGVNKQIALGLPAFTLTTEHLLLSTVLDTGDVGRWLQENGLEPAELYRRIDMLTNPEYGSRERNEVERPDQPANDPVTALRSVPGFHNISGFHSSSLYRLLDAAANRGREAIRVLEDYVRFILDDADLTQRLKTYRHQFQNVLQQFPMQSRLEARNTEYDVGTEISAEGEYLRPTVDDILSANFSRLQESLRSLEEFSKMFDPQVARQFEQLRYLGYTLQKDVVHESRERNEVERPDQPANDPVTALRSVPGFHWDNARLYALVDTRPDEEAFAQFITAIIAGGVDIIQLRDKHADDRTLLARSRILKECIAASDREVLFIMNDRPDLAVLAGADGVHVGQDELPVTQVRQIVGALLIGVSTHSIEQARQAVRDGADYIGAGPVYESATKEFTQLAGLDYLREVAAEIELPTFAIGGITEERLAEVFQTGICRVVVGSAFLQAEDPQETVARWRRKFNEYERNEYDSQT